MSLAVVPCNTRCLNMGDVAMLQVAVGRLRAWWRWEELRVFTSDPLALLRYCPGVTPVMLPDQPAWCRDRYLGGRLHSWLSEARSDQLANLSVAIACRWPSLREPLLRARAVLRADERASLHDFLDSIDRARLVVTSGAGGIADHFHDYSNLVLLALQCAQARGIPTAILGHGFGPLTSPDLRAKAAVILPRVNLIALREERASLPLLISLGVSQDRIVTTGDDAVELAYEARPLELGNAIGVNLRLARSSAATEQDIVNVREGLRRFARRWLAPLVAVPIARQRNLDADVIRQLIPEGSSDGRELDTPLKVIQQIGGCRIVVTGAYHAAVFALAQGVPAVCLARSPYFFNKFLGLADQFGAGCHLVSLDDEALPQRLAEAMEQAWDEGPRVREWLWRAAATQIARGQDVYARLHDLVEHSGRNSWISRSTGSPEGYETASDDGPFARDTRRDGESPPTDSARDDSVHIALP
jgi:polysaccharide pyruvyl transferase WcaK-like protein